MKYDEHYLAQYWFIFNEELPQTIWASFSTAPPPPPPSGNAQIHTFFLGWGSPDPCNPWDPSDHFMAFGGVPPNITVKILG